MILYIQYLLCYKQTNKLQPSNLLFIVFQIIDIINLFKQPELTRTLPGFALIKKKQLLDVRKGFKWEQNNFYYLMPDGSFSETAEDEKFADFNLYVLHSF